MAVSIERAQRLAARIKDELLALEDQHGKAKFRHLHALLGLAGTMANDHWGGEVVPLSGGTPKDPPPADE